MFAEMGMTTDSSSSIVFGTLPVGATFRFVGNPDTYRKVATEVAWCDATAASWAHIVPADRPVIPVNDPTTQAQEEGTCDWDER